MEKQTLEQSSGESCQTMMTEKKNRTRERPANTPRDEESFPPFLMRSRFITQPSRCQKTELNFTQRIFKFVAFLTGKWLCFSAWGSFELFGLMRYEKKGKMKTAMVNYCITS